MLSKILASGYSQLDVARAVGVSQNAISKIGNGKTQAVKYETGKGIERLYSSIFGDTN